MYYAIVGMHETSPYVEDTMVIDTSTEHGRVRSQFAFEQRSSRALWMVM